VTLSCPSVDTLPCSDRDLSSNGTVQYKRWHNIGQA